MIYKISYLYDDKTDTFSSKAIMLLFANPCIFLGQAPDIYIVYR